jgi:hypothetical protein
MVPGYDAIGSVLRDPAYLVHDSEGLAEIYRTGATIRRRAPRPSSA